MKNYQIVFACLLFFTVVCTSNSYTAYSLNVNFDGASDGGTDYGYGNIPMPSDPTPVSSGSSYSTKSSTSTHSSTSSHTTHTYTPSLNQQVQMTIMSSLIQAALSGPSQSQKAAQQAAAEQQRKLEEAKKKKAAKKWLQDYEDTTPKVNPNSTVGSLKGYDPVAPKKLDSYIPPLGQTNDTNNEGIKIPKLQSDDQNKNISSISKPLHPQSEFMTPGRTEGQLREMYFNSDRQLMQCASGKMECSPELVKQLEVKRLTAEQGLVTSYKYKIVNGEFIKKPN